MSVPATPTSTFDRSDTLLGVCEAIGQDLGFNGQWLRVALAIGVFWSPVAMIVLYLALGVAVWTARWLTPVRGVAGEAVIAPVADNDDEAEVLAQAA